MAQIRKALTGAKNGEEWAFDVLFRAFHAPLLRYIRAQRIRWVDDVADEVWTEVGRTIASFDGDPADFRRWLFTIAHRRSVRARFVGDLPVRHGGDDATIDDALFVVQRLAPDDAEIVVLRLVLGLPTGDVAAIVGAERYEVEARLKSGVARMAAWERGPTASDVA